MPPLCPQEEEERKAQEEQAQREHEEYLKLKETFVVEEEGVGETMTEEQVGPPALGNVP